MQFVEDSAFGKNRDLFRGRKAGDSFVGPPGGHIYHASGEGMMYHKPVASFSSLNGGTISQHELRPSSSPSCTQDISLTVRGTLLGRVNCCSDPFLDGVIPEFCLQKLGWSRKVHAAESAAVPMKLWQTLVAGRGSAG